MAIVEKVDNVEGLYLVACPACKQLHQIPTTKEASHNGAVWKFDGDMKRPSFSPSLHIKDESGKTKCHSFIEQGHFRFLSDCNHSFANMMVPMADIDEIWDLE